MGWKTQDRPSLLKFVGAIIKAPARLARKVLQQEPKPQRSQSRKARRRDDARYGRFADLPGRRKNIASTIQRWRSADKRRQLVRAANEPLPYERAPRLLTEGEYAFWVPLFHAVKGRYRIFCKVRLADVVCCPKQRSDEGRWFRKIGRFHLDFVICDPETTRPLLVVELDDRSHREGTAVRREFDAWKDEVLRAARMPVYRVPAREAYDVPELRDVVERMIGEAER